MSRSKRKNRRKQKSNPSSTKNIKDEVVQTENKKSIQVPSTTENPKVSSSTLKSLYVSVRRTSLLVWSAIIVISVIVGIIGIVQFSPRVSVVPYESLDPSTPFSSLFIVSNDGLFPIHNVEFWCEVENAIATNNVEIGGFKTMGNAKPISIINPAGKETTQCAWGLFAPASGQFEDADISIAVNFLAYWIPSSQTKNFRFVTRKDKSGQLHWFPKSITE